MQAGGSDGGKLLTAIQQVLNVGNNGADSGMPKGFKIGLHTAGAYPENLRKLLPYIDWIGFDIKAPTGLYDLITNVPNSEIPARKSLNLILEEREFRKRTDHPLDIQFRTTVDLTVLNDKHIVRLQDELRDKGVDNLVLQEVRTMGAPPEYAARIANI
jgi:pyruvate formate lyase activating enzyme